MWHLECSFLEHEVGRTCLWDMGVENEHRGLLIIPFNFFVSTMLSLWGFFFQSSSSCLHLRLTGLLLGPFTIVVKLPGVGVLLCAYFAAIGLSSLRTVIIFFLLFFFVLFITSSLWILLPFPILMTLYPVRTFGGHHLSELLEHLVPLSCTVPMPWLYKFTWILAFLRWKGWTCTASFKF